MIIELVIYARYMISWYCDTWSPGVDSDGLLEDKTIRNELAKILARVIIDLIKSPTTPEWAQLGK